MNLELQRSDKKYDKNISNNRRDVVNECFIMHDEQVYDEAVHAIDPPVFSRACRS
jgi:hypothetical protein